jgi:hypothetical protein
MLMFGAMALAPDRAVAQSPAVQSAQNQARTVWYFYRVKWGYQEEFVRLYEKNHYPILKAQLETGRIVGMKSYVPTYHGDGRADWTFAVELTFASADAFYDNSGAAAIIARLYPDQATFQREEQRRFEIVDAHWDVPLNVVDFR